LPKGCVVGARRAYRWYLLCLKADPADPSSAFLPRVVAVLGAHGWRGLLGPGALGGAAPRLGHWQSLAVSPDGTHLLLQGWGDCGAPTAVLADSDGRHAHPVAAHTASQALGFEPGGAALVAFPQPACAGAGLRPGVYRIPATGSGRAALYPLTRRV